MAHVLCFLEPHPKPQRGEKVALVRMSVHPQQGWRISASSDRGRIIGRWVSECARTITDMAYSWLSGFGWEVAEHPQTTHSFADAFEQAETAPAVPGTDPKMVFDVLIRNYTLPGGPPEVEKRQSRMIAGPTHQRPAIRRRDEVAPASSDLRQAWGPDTHSRKDVDHFLRDAGKALEQGAAPDAVQLYMLEYFFQGQDVVSGDPPDAMDLARFLRGLRKGLRDNWSYEDMRRSVLGSLALVEQEDVQLNRPVRQVRPLMPDENLDDLGLSDEQRKALEAMGPEDPALRKKVERTLASQRQAIQAAGPLKPGHVHALLQHDTIEQTEERIALERQRMMEREARREAAARARAEAERLEMELGADEPPQRAVTGAQDEAQPSNGGGQPMQPEPELEDEVPMYDDSMTKAELVAIAVAAGLSDKGNKKQIIARLDAHYME